VFRVKIKRANKDLSKYPTETLIIWPEFQAGKTYNNQADSGNQGVLYSPGIDRLE
jgi:hypothetical protein